MRINKIEMIYNNEERNKRLLFKIGLQFRKILHKHVFEKSVEYKATAASNRHISNFF